MEKKGHRAYATGQYVASGRVRAIFHAEGTAGLLFYDDYLFSPFSFSYRANDFLASSFNPFFS